MARRDIEFNAEGATLRGWFYSPDSGSANKSNGYPCIVMAHGYSAVKEQHLDDYAEVFAAAGLACVVYDNRGFGSSDAGPGEPRLEIDPWKQVRDYQHAITYAQSRDDVDAARIGVWGSSYSGGHAYVVGAIDRRVRAVCGQVPLVSGRRAFNELVRIDQWAPTWDAFTADRLERARGGQPAMMPVVTNDPAGQAALPTSDSYEFFMRTQSERAPSWENQVTLRSVELLQGYEPGRFLPLISPTPVLMVVAPDDRLVAGEAAAGAYEDAVHPKQLVTVPGGHFDAYTGPGFRISSSAACDWFLKHLGS